MFFFFFLHPRSSKHTCLGNSSENCIYMLRAEFLLQKEETCVTYSAGYSEHTKYISYRKTGLLYLLRGKRSVSMSLNNILPSRYL